MADAFCIDEGCPNHGIPHVCVTITVTRADKLELFKAFCKKFKRQKLLEYLFDTLERHVRLEDKLRAEADARLPAVVTLGELYRIYNDNASGNGERLKAFHKQYPHGITLHI